MCRKTRSPLPVDKTTHREFVGRSPTGRRSGGRRKKRKDHLPAGPLADGGSCCFCYDDQDDDDDDDDDEEKEEQDDEVNPVGVQTRGIDLLLLRYSWRSEALFT